MDERYTAVVVGAGAGGKLSIAGLAASERFELLAVADLRDDVRRDIEGLYPGIRTFATHTEMFAACPADVVCVSTYAPTHHAIACDALRLPLRGIVVEKPLADTSASGRDLIEQIKARNLPMAVPHGLLVARHGQEILQRVRGGEIGDLVLVEIECDKWDILNAGIHWLNFFVVLTGSAPLHSVIAQCDTSTRTYRDGLQVETLAVTYAQTKTGVRVVMQTGDYVEVAQRDKPFLFRLVGTHGVIEFWGWESAYRITNREHPDGTLIQVIPHDRSHHQRHLEALADQIDHGTPDYSIAESSLMALELCEGAYLSHQHRCLVTFPLDQFVPPQPLEWHPGQPYAGSGGGRNGRTLRRM